MTRQPQAAEYHPWTTSIYAREEARRRGDRKVGTEHLVLGLLHEPALAHELDTDVPSARAALEQLDREALAAVGIGPALDAPPVPAHMFDGPPRPTIKAVLQDRLGGFTPAAKTALQQAAKGMRRGRKIPPERVLLALLALEPPDPAAGLFAALGADRAAVRARLSEPRAA